MAFMLFPAPAGAYIPAYSMLLSRLAQTQGKKAYRIKQELHFKEGVKPVNLMETWWIHSPGEMRLDVSSADKKDLHLRFLYKGDKKIFRDENNKIKKQPLSYYHLEKPFHLRKASRLKKLFSVWKVAPFFPPERKEGQSTDFFVRLTRRGGGIQYQIGRKEARVWMEQDEFVIRSWKWAGGEAFWAWDYKLYPGHLFFPSERLLRHHSKSVKIKLKNLQNVKPLKNRMKQSLLSKKNRISKNFSEKQQESIREFYEKYR